MQVVFRSEQKYSSNRGDEIEVTPEFAKLFNESTTLSSKLHTDMITFREQWKVYPTIEADKEGSRNEQEWRRKGNYLNLFSKERQWRERQANRWAKSKIALFEKENFELLEHRDKLSKLYDLGLIDSAGDPLIAHSDDDIQVEKKEEFIRF